MTRKTDGGVKPKGETLIARRKAVTLDTILDCAERLMAKHGYRETSMDDVATAANISRKTLFNYVRSKDMLLIAAIRRRFGPAYTGPFAEPQALATGEIADILPPDQDRRLVALADARWLLKLGVVHANLFSSDEDGGVLGTLSPDHAARVRRIALLQQNGKIRSNLSAEAICRHFEVVRNAVFRRWLLRDASTLEELREDFREAVTLFLHGIEARR